jgi:hypothetical protein
MRSAYRMLIRTKERREAWLEGRASSSIAEVEKKQWSLLWKTHVPSKIKIFLWRLAKQSLLTNDGRHQQRIAEDDRCTLCTVADSWRHALIDCTMAHCVWVLVNPETMEHMCRNEEGDARRWLALLIDTLSQEDQTRVFVTLWAMWHARRKALYENQF